MLAVCEKKDEGSDQEEYDVELAEEIKEESQICGMTKSPIFPLGMILALVWSGFMSWKQVLTLSSVIPQVYALNYFFWALYPFTICAAFYATVSDPGTLTDDQLEEYEETGQLPQRAHKHWMYDRPIRRFHQYCRWVTNCIGLRNHRTYILLLLGVFLMASSNTLLDLLAAPLYYRQGDWASLAALIFHTLFSAYVTYYSGPLLYAHMRFVIRNELVQEYKKDHAYVVTDEMGKQISVNELEVEDYNSLFDTFQYEPSLNPWDHGWYTNFTEFWLTDRSDEDELGDF
mmetsp:Transcript_25610/g.54344  ORF Transcript_25610/g.54344 Transcript_25610/m.54344 type:complete len:287 (+) Transcript_25610:225-1085(+)